MMKYTPEVKSRIEFLLNKIEHINVDEKAFATFKLDPWSITIRVKDKEGNPIMRELVYELTEQKVFELYLKLDDIEFGTKK